MDYLSKSAEVRCDPRHPRMLADAQSVLVLATPYAQQDAPKAPSYGVVARYARGFDYHDVLGQRLEKIVAFLNQLGYRSRYSVDSMPVMERAWARVSGLGFIGNNSCLVIPGLGSFVFLSTVLTTAELRPDEPIDAHCGSCQMCLSHCPTGALQSPRQIDARLCISYMTGVLRGSIPVELRSRIGNRVLGCDACQERCPYNESSPYDPNAATSFGTHRLWEEFDAEALLQMDEETFKKTAQASPAYRVGRERIARNTAIVLGNSGESKYLNTLQRAADADPSPVVREAARWATQNRLV
jgi:epoxyqueuosine reductase